MTFKIATININGMRSRYRNNHFYFKSYQKIKQLIKQGYIICIQEPKLQETHENLIKLHMKAHISSEGHGLITLIPENVSIINKENKQNGRVQITTLMVEDSKYTICNVYAPTEKNQKIKRQFFNELSYSIEEAKEKNINSRMILAGDFNVNLDKNCTARTVLYNITSRVQLMDAYRHRHPDAKGFTRFPTLTQKGNPTRIDAFFIPSDRGKLKFTRYDIPKSDHKLCTLQIFNDKNPKQAQNPQKKPTFHKTLLENKVHINNKKIIEDHEDTAEHEQSYTALIDKLMKYSKVRTRKVTSPHDQRMANLHNW